MEKKIRAAYFIQPELNQKLASYAKAKAVSRTEALNTIISSCLTSKEIQNEIKKSLLKNKQSKKRIDYNHWTRRSDYVYKESYEKIKSIAKTVNLSISEILDDFLDKYLSQVNPTETLEETLKNLFN